MRSLITITAAFLLVSALQGCAVTVVNVVHSDLGYVDQAVNDVMNESNME